MSYIVLHFPQNFTTRQKYLVEIIVKYHNSLVHPNKELCQRNLTLVDTFRIHFCSSRPVELKLNLPLEHSAPFNSITQYFLCDRKKVTEKEYVYTYPMYNKEISNHDGLRKISCFMLRRSTNQMEHDGNGNTLCCTFFLWLQHSRELLGPTTNEEHFDKENITAQRLFLAG